MRTHNPGSIIHRTSEKVVQHLVDEDGICDHSFTALAAMFGCTVPTIYVVRQHLESCPTSLGVRLPYRAKEDVVLADPLLNHPTLEDHSKRMAPTVWAAKSITLMLNRMRDRNCDGLRAMAQDAYARGETEYGDVYEAMAMDYETRGTLHPMTERALAALGVTL